MRKRESSKLICVKNLRKECCRKNKTYERRNTREVRPVVIGGLPGIREIAQHMADLKLTRKVAGKYR